MIIPFARHESAHAVADALEGVGVPCEVYPVDVSVARPWFVDLSDAVDQRHRDAMKAERRALFAEAMATDFPPYPMTSTEIESLSVDPTRSDPADNTREEPET